MKLFSQFILSVHCYIYRIDGCQKIIHGDSAAILFLYLFSLVTDNADILKRKKKYLPIRNIKVFLKVIRENLKDPCKTSQNK